MGKPNLTFLYFSWFYILGGFVIFLNEGITPFHRGKTNAHWRWQQSWEVAMRTGLFWVPRLGSSATPTVALLGDIRFHRPLALDEHRAPSTPHGAIVRKDEVKSMDGLRKVQNELRNHKRGCFSPGKKWSFIALFLFRLQSHAPI